MTTSQTPVSVEDAALLLNTTPEAIRKRIKRNKLRADKQPDGRWLVFLDATPPDPTGQDDTGQSTGQTHDRTGRTGQPDTVHLQALEAENDILRQELDQVRDQARQGERYEAENILLREQLADTKGERDRWHDAAREAMAAASETRRLALVYAPTRKRKELAALMGVNPEELPPAATVSPWLTWLVLVSLLVAAGTVVAVYFW